jgi:pimeloyl-ACP methyl ester carboxylesterase
VLCNPLGVDAIRAHRAYRQLASLLSKARFHVLRFDYFGTGDSAGETEEGDLAQWVEDIGTAADELRDLTGVARVSLVGLRLGGTLALLAGKDRTDLGSLVLWDPVVSGASHVEELRTMHRDYLRQELGDGFDPAGAAASSEALGFPLTEAMVGRLRATDLTTVAGCAVRSASLIVSRPGDEYQRLRDRLAGLGARVEYQEVASAQWNSDEAMNAALVPSGILQAIVARLTSPA